MSLQTIIPDVDNWLENGSQFIAVATVVQTWGSAPRQAGAKMAFTADGRLSGSVSGGCIEGAVIEAGQTVLQNGRPQLLHFGVADETAWEVGLACGGSIEVWVERLDTAVYQAHRQIVLANQEGAVVTAISGKKAGAKTCVNLTTGKKTGRFTLPQPIANQLPAIKKSGRQPLSNGDQIFIEAIRPFPTLVMIGGVQIAIALNQFAKTLGYRTIIIDPRRAFGNAERFPNADQVIAAWPDKAFKRVELTTETAVTLLTHDAKIDDPALLAALNSPARYIGALGSKNTHAKRCQRLRNKGVSDAQIKRIHAPIGLDIGARTPEAIALAIMAEIIKVG